MSEALKHTPGPWSLAPHSDTDEVINVVANYKDLGNGRSQADWIAELDAQLDFDSDVDEQRDRMHANAHLIAASPELYAFAEAVMRSGLLSGESLSQAALRDLQRLGTDALNHAQGDDLP